MLNAILREFLVRTAAAAGADLTLEDVEKFSKYGDLLLEWNKIMNLTAVTDEREIVLKHYIDSITILPYLDRICCKTFIDIGTGAGFPGIPVKILRPDINVVLLDSLGKRVNFLNIVISELGLKEIRAVHMRAEDGGKSQNYRENFDFCVSRAVASLDVLSEYCLPFVKVGGYFISMKGPAVFEEAEKGERAIEVLGGKLEEIREIDVPFVEGKRYAAVIRKIGKTPEKYPRKAGKAAKSPIK